MTGITARIPAIDWTQGFDRHWNGGNAAVTHAFNALSFLFPQAERYFIDVVRDVLRTTDIRTDPDLEAAVRGFIAQESTHSQQHARYNAILEHQGFENIVHDWVRRLQERSLRDFAPLTRLAIVCGYEHYTAILGDYLLNHPEVLEHAPPDLALVWGWHSAEETEHKAVCFDLYRAAGGGWLRRVVVFVLVTWNFQFMFTCLYFSMLRRDGCLSVSRLAGTIRKAARHFFGRSGVAWHFLQHGFRYFSPQFHPWTQDNRKVLQAWLDAHRSRLRDVGGGNTR